MSYFQCAVVLIIAVVILYQVWITIKLVQAIEYAHAQKIVQLIFIWCIPVVGAGIVHLILTDTSSNNSTENNRHIPQNENISDYSPFNGHHD